MEQIKVKKIADNIYRMQEDNADGGVDAYLICGADSALMIDGLDSADGLLECVRKMTDKPVKMVITHGHPDHAGKGMQEFLQNECEVYLSDKDLNLVEQMYPAGLDKTYLRSLADGDVFDLGEITVKVMEMPGHTKGSVLLYIGQEKMLFTSDAIGSGGLWMQLPESTFLEEYLKEVKKLEAFLKGHEGVKLYPGHSWQISPYHEEGQDYLDHLYVAELRELTEKILAGELEGEKVDLQLEFLKEIDMRSIKGTCVTDYCYDAQKLKKEN